MNAKTVGTTWAYQPIHRLHSLSSTRNGNSKPGLSRERAWQQPCSEAMGTTASSIFVSRWIDERSTARIERSSVPADRYIIGVALKPVRLRMQRGAETAYEGTMMTGTVYVVEPEQIVQAEFFTSCDFVHFHVAADYLHRRRSDRSAELRHNGGAEGTAFLNVRSLLIRDDLTAQLTRTLTDDMEGCDPLYAESVGQTILMRILARRPSVSRVGTLPKWRLRRVQEHLEANISEPISLADLAQAAGLSRMHFAAQFREATGCRPHEYLLQHRIERAKQMLADTDSTVVDVALSVGFQTQSHFTTVFRRLAGNSPARWRRSLRTSPSSCDSSDGLGRQLERAT